MVSIKVMFQAISEIGVRVENVMKSTANIPKIKCSKLFRLTSLNESIILSLPGCAFKFRPLLLACWLCNDAPLNAHSAAAVDGPIATSNNVDHTHKTKIVDRGVYCGKMNPIIAVRVISIPKPFLHIRIGHHINSWPQLRRWEFAVSNISFTLLTLVLPGTNSFE
jgi:hypothetical protein